MSDLPISLDIIQKYAVIPAKLAELTYTKPEVAIELMRIFGEERMPITPMFDLIMSHFKEVKEDESNTA